MKLLRSLAYGLIWTLGVIKKNLVVSFVIRRRTTTSSAFKQFEWCQEHWAKKPYMPTSSNSCIVHTRPTVTATSQTTTTRLHALLDVPDGFFAVTFPVLGILLSISKNFARVRMEERAWEQRLEEAREERLRQDPSVTEIDLRRKEAALEWSAYGKPRLEVEAAKAAISEAMGKEDRSDNRRRGRARVDVLDEEDFARAADGGSKTAPRSYRMTEEEIEAFELEYGVSYDPYYDDPYTSDELPDGKYEVDRLYGDRIYPNGEIFYKDSQTGLFYRQGCKPRNLSFWN